MVIVLRAAACFALLGFVATATMPVAPYVLLLAAVCAAGLAEILNEVRRLRQLVQGDRVDPDKARILERLTGHPVRK